MKLQDGIHMTSSKVTW